MSNSVSTSLYIGGKERQTADKMAIADPAKPGVVVGHAAAATTQDVSDAVAAAKAAYPAWAALSPQQRAEKMLAALEGIAENRDDDAAILSQENGKVRFEAWIDSLVLELRWKLALSHADEVNASKVLPPIPGAIPVQTTVAYQPLGVVTHHRAVQLADRHPRGRATACAAGRQHGHREAAPDGAAGHGPRRAAYCRAAPARRAQRASRARMPT